MQIFMGFLLNLSILVTFAYLFNLLFKYLFSHLSPKKRQIVIFFVFISAGWISMVFALRGQGFTLFDLRAVPIIFATLIFRKPIHLVIIGTGISIGRIVITGITPQAITGSINIFLLGCFGAFLVYYYNKNSIRYLNKALLSVFSIITLQVTFIALFGALPTEYYLTQIFPYTYPMGLVLSLFFVFMISDFHKEQSRADDIRTKNLILSRQTKDLRQIKRELEEKARELTLSSKYKSEFIANMSHELKTPLNSIILLSELIRDNENADDQKQNTHYADLINTSGNELLRIIEDILDLSKIEAGKMDIYFEQTSIEDLTEMLHQEFEPLTRDKNLQLDIHSDLNTPNVMTTDIYRLRQILRNLIINAIKFTDIGTVGLNIKLKEYNGEDASIPSIVFTVFDTGIGIDPDNKQYIFEAFRQEDGAINRKYGGAGLGLPISLQLARLLGGTLTVQSIIGEGSHFSLVLPLRPIFNKSSTQEF